MSAPLLPVAEATARVVALFSPVGTEQVGLAEAGGRVLAEAVVARRDQPPFPASAMDGYAVQSADIASGAVLRVIGESQAGGRFSGVVGPGEAVRIFTGAPVPPGADRILIQEDAERTGDRVTVGPKPDQPSYVRPAGLDFKAGERIEAPRRISSGDVALFAAMNAPRVTVRRRPVVAIIPTGDELVEPGETPGPDQIVSSNGYGLTALLAAHGAAPRQLPIARDTAESLRAALDAAADADLIVTLGGASVGDHDLVSRVAGDAGLTLDFHRIAMRPGKPLLAGMLGETPLIGLPGNPVSAMVCGHLFLRPAIDAMLGLPAGPPERERGRLAEPVEANGAREHYARAALTRENGETRLRLFRRQDSSVLSVLSRAGALAVLPPHAPAMEAGAEIEFIRL